MAKNSNIEWTDNSWNPWHGCKKVSDGCKYCYMYRDKDKYGQDPMKVVRSKTTFNDPLKWKEPQKVFTCSWSDFFIEEADAWRGEAWDIIRRTLHIYQILTKRVDRVYGNLPLYGPYYWEASKNYLPGLPYNVWLGASTENQKTFTERWPVLAAMKVYVPGTYFLSIEPLLGPVDLSLNTHLNKPDWVIIGGESGNDNGKWLYRRMELEWMENIVAQCRDYDIPVFVKQLGTYQAKKLGLNNRHGKDINEFPEELKIREFPKVYQNESKKI